jgi:LmbE family N-acetylglucosaminyl deacetylase
MLPAHPSKFMFYGVHPLHLPAIVIATACAAPAASPSPRTLVAVLAHPDDETLFSPALAHYAREGVQVFVVIATDGSQGVAPHAGIPAGDSLATIRVEEARCSTRELGLRDPVMLGLPDAGLAVLRPWPGEPLDRLVTRLEALFRELRPQAVITLGAVPPPARLFFPGFTAERMASGPRRLSVTVYPTTPALLTTRVAFGPGDLAAARRALACHRSQFTEATMHEISAVLEHWWQGGGLFQEWRGGGRSEGLFDY